MVGVECKYQAVNSVIFAQWYLLSAECVGVADRATSSLIGMSCRWILVGGMGPSLSYPSVISDCLLQNRSGDFQRSSPKAGTLSSSCTLNEFQGVCHGA